MSSELNITAAIGMPSGDPNQRQVLQQTWSSVNNLVEMSSESTNFLEVLAFLTPSSVEAQSGLGNRAHP